LPRFAIQAKASAWGYVPPLNFAKYCTAEFHKIVKAQVYFTLNYLFTPQLTWYDVDKKSMSLTDIKLPYV
jgi:hypothetical protein